MPVPIDFYDATFVFKAATGNREMTFSIGMEDSILAGSRSAEEAADDMYDAAAQPGSIGAINSMIDDYTFVGTSVAKGTATGDQVGQHFAPLVGTVTDSCVPANCAVLVKKNTALGGRRFRGRIFQPPTLLNEGAVDASGNIAAGGVAAIQATWDQFSGQLVANGYLPVLFHQGVGAPAPTLISSLQVTSLIATQRRRLR